MFAYGAQYYRPPNPPSDVWTDDIEQMADLGFNTVKLWAMWNHTQPAEDEFDFSELEELVEIAREQDLQVVISLILENAPHWLAQRYPEARYEDQDGLKVDLRARPNTPGGGWPGLCLNHPGVREQAERYTRVLGETFSDKSVVTSYTTWDEAFFEPNLHFPDKRFCYCDACTNEFRQWLQSRYNDLDGLNDAWETRYTAWDQVEPPAFHGGYPRYLDWLRFRLDSHQQHMQWRANTLADADDTAIVRAHGISGNLGDLPHRFNDDWRSATTVDEWGTTTFPHWGPDHPEITTDAQRQAVDHHLMLDVARGASQGQSFWQTELQGGHVRSGNSIDPMGLTRGPSPDPESVALWNWNALAGGASGLLYWQYRPELLGHESPGFGLVRRDGSTTERTAVASQFATLVDSHPVFESATPVDGDVAIGALPEAPLFNYVAEKDTDQFASAIRGLYRAVWGTDYQVDFAKPHQFDGYEVVFLPFPLLLDERTVDRMESYVQGGGTLIADGVPCVFDDNGRAFRNPPGRGLDEVFGTTLKTARQESAASLSLSPGPNADESRETVPSAARRDVFEPDSAKAIGQWSDGGIGATWNDYGDGTAIALGTLVGRAYTLSDASESIRTLVTEIAANSGAVPRVRVSEAEVQTRLHEYDDGLLLYLLNPTADTQRVDVEINDVPGSRGETIGDVDIVADQSLQVTIDDRSGGVLKFYHD